MKQVITTLAVVLIIGSTVAQNEDAIENAAEKAVNDFMPVINSAMYKCTTMAHIGVLNTPTDFKSLKLTKTQKAALSKYILRLTSSKTVSVQQAEQAIDEIKVILGRPNYVTVMNKADHVGLCDYFYGKNTLKKLTNKVTTSIGYNPFYNKNTANATALNVLKVLSK